MFLLSLCTAITNVFPTLHEIAGTMEANFQQWAQRRLTEIRDGSAADAAKSEETAKLLDRMQKFKDKMSFVTTLQSMPQRKRISFQKK